MDINDIIEPRMDFNPIVEEPMPELEEDDNEVVPAARGANPSSMIDPVVHELGVDDILP